MDILKGFRLYIEEVKKKTAETYKDSATAFPIVDFTEGKKYWKVIVSTYGSRSVHSFVDRSNGDVLKPASWAAPAKHARGNVLNSDHGANALTNYGIKYLN